MKRPLFILVLSLAASGCINKIPIEFGEPVPQLVLNAQMRAQEGTQIIYLGESTLTMLNPLHDADVNVLVDGKFFAKAEEMTTGTDLDFAYSAPYCFQGGFPAGSQVQVTVKKDAWDASARADVCPAPVISAVDTLRSVEQALEYSYEAFQVKISFQDLPGESYYRAGVRASTRITQVNAAGETNVIPQEYELPMSGSMDPVLGGTTAGMSIFNLEKTYLAFSDEMFRDQDYTLRLSIITEQMYPYYYVRTEGFIPVYTIISTTLYPWLESISREEYDYLNALNNLENFGYTSQMIVEPTTLPTNVNGGLGFFAVLNRTEAASMVLPPVRIDFHYGTENEQHAGQQ